MVIQRKPRPDLFDIVGDCLFPACIVLLIGVLPGIIGFQLLYWLLWGEWRPISVADDFPLSAAILLACTLSVCAFTLWGEYSEGRRLRGA
jgi:hypothetical protein